VLCYFSSRTPSTNPPPPRHIQRLIVRLKSFTHDLQPVATFQQIDDIAEIRPLHHFVSIDEDRGIYWVHNELDMSGSDDIHRTKSLLIV
jgi:hypothetical protein